MSVCARRVVKWVGRWDNWWWWLFAIAAAPTLILLAYAVARRRPPRSRDSLNVFLVLLAIVVIALHLWAVFS